MAKAFVRDRNPQTASIQRNPKEEAVKRTVGGFSGIPQPTLSPEDIQILYEALMQGKPYPSNSPGVDPWGEALPAVPRAPLFRPDPMIVGRPSLSPEVEHLLRQFPDMRGRVPQIIEGPDASVMRQLQGTPFGPEDFPALNLGGITNRVTGNIAVNPNVREEDLPEIIAHEYTHVLGGGDGVAYPIGANYGEQRKKKK